MSTLEVVLISVAVTLIVEGLIIGAFCWWAFRKAGDGEYNFQD